MRMIFVKLPPHTPSATHPTSHLAFSHSQGFTWFFCPRLSESQTQTPAAQLVCLTVCQRVRTLFSSPASAGGRLGLCFIHFPSQDFITVGKDKSHLIRTVYKSVLLLWFHRLFQTFQRKILRNESEWGQCTLLYPLNSQLAQPEVIQSSQPTCSEWYLAHLS